MPFLLEEIKCIMFQLLNGIEYLHSKWYIHRDLKTSNILYKAGRICISDFGSARKYGDPLRAYTQLIVTQHYRSPELLISSKYSEKLKYSTAVDMWSVGCIFGELLIGKPLFNGTSEIDQLCKIFDVLGTPTNKELSKIFELLKSPKKSQLKQKLQQYGGYNGKIFISTQGYDLLKRLLEYDPNKRITASEALQHPYFMEKPIALSISRMPNFKYEDGKFKRVVTTLKDIYLRKE